MRDPPGAAVPLSQVPAKRDPAVHADVLPQQLLWSATATVASAATIFLNRVLPTVPAGPRLFLSRPFFLKEFVLCLRLLGVRWRRLLHSPWALDPALSSYLQSTVGMSKTEVV